ncbi:hypothetical protein COLO4_01442, partial [Corchorus olitorius]
RIQRQDDFKRTADAIGVVFYPESAEVGFYDGAADIQPHAHAVGFCTEERLEQPLLGAVVYARALVDHLDQHGIFRIVDQVGVQAQDAGGAQARVGGHGFGGVLEQIDKHLLDQHRIDIQMRQVARQARQDGDAAPRGLQLGQADGVGDDVAQVGFAPLRLAAFNETANALDDGAGTHGLGGGLFQHRDQLFRRAPPRLQAADRTHAVIVDGRQRLVQLVRQRRRHLAHCRQAAGELEALFVLARHLFSGLAHGDVGGDLHLREVAVDPLDVAAPHFKPFLHRR